MSPLALQVFQLHKSDPGWISFADQNLQREHGLTALDAAYADLLELGFVHQRMFTTTSTGEGRPCFEIAPSGREAVRVTAKH